MAQPETGAAGTVHFEPGGVAFRDDNQSKARPAVTRRSGSNGVGGSSRYLEAALLELPSSIGLAALADAFQFLFPIFRAHLGASLGLSAGRGSAIDAATAGAACPIAGEPSRGRASWDSRRRCRAR